MDNLWINYGKSMDLVGGIPTPLRTVKVNVDDYSQSAICGKVKNVPNHNPDTLYTCINTCNYKSMTIHITATGRWYTYLPI